MSGVDRLLTEPCTVTNRARSGTKDDRGNPQRSTTTVSTHCYVDQVRRPREGTEGEDLSVDQWKVYLPADTPIASTSTIDVRGITFSVEGDPRPLWNPVTSEYDHIEAWATTAQIA